MLRLTILSESPEETILRIDGWLAGASVGLLRQEMARYLGDDRRLVLDLSGVRFVDDTCVELLRQWVAEGVELRNRSAFVRALLEE